MNYIEEAVKRAIEGGYKQGKDILAAIQIGQRKNLEFVVFCDPLFWSALGKSEGWSGTNTACNKCGVAFNGWKGHWHRFIDHLIEGKSIESFFEGLLAKK